MRRYIRSQPPEAIHAMPVPKLFAAFQAEMPGLCRGNRTRTKLVRLRQIEAALRRIQLQGSA